MTRVRAIARGLPRCGIAVTLLVALSGAFESIGAEIYEWVDSAGDRHFDTSLEQVPEEARAQARIVVGAVTPGTADGASGASASTAAEPTTEKAEPTTEKNERDDSFESGWDAGFRAGWETGYRTAAEEQPVCPTEPGVIALQSQPPVVVNVPPYDPTGAYYRNPYGGLLTVPFDGGASFGLTSRNQMQQMRTIERGW